MWTIGIDCAPSTISPTVISWLKLSDASVQTFLKLKNDIHFYLIYMLGHIYAQISH